MARDEERQSEPIPPADSYWSAALSHINQLMQNGKVTSYDAEAFVWAHNLENLTNDAFLATLDERLRNKKWLRKNKHALTIAAKSSNEYMTAAGVFFSITSAITSIVLIFRPLSSLINFIDDIVNNTSWDSSDSLLSLIVGIDLIKNGLTFDAAANLSVAALLIPTTVAYTLTLPHINIITNALCGIVFNIGMNILFAIAMWVVCLTEIRHAIQGNQLIKNLTDQLSTLALATQQETTETQFLKNMIAFETFQVKLHKKNAYLWGGSAALMTGSAVLTTLIVLGAIGSGAVTMGVIPAILGIACAILAIWRWHLNRNTKAPKLSTTPLPIGADNKADREKISLRHNKSSIWSSEVLRASISPDILLTHTP